MLEQLLRSVRGIRGLSRVFEALGYQPDRRQEQLALIPRAAFLDALQQSRKEEATARWDVRAGASPLRLDLDAIATWKTNEFGYVCQCRGCALSDNAVVILVEFVEERQGPEGPRRDRFWNVVAYAREGGEKMWEIDLPSVPLHDGLAIAADGRVVVADRGTQEVRVFDADGHYLTSVGGQGRGPGEFRDLRNVFRLGDDSLLATEAGGRAHVFHVDGHFGRQIRTDLAPGDGAARRYPVMLGAFDTGELVVTPYLHLPPPPEFEGAFRDTMYVSVFDPEGHLLRQLGRFLGRARYWQKVDISLPYPAETFVRVAGNHLYVVDNARYEIQVRSPLGDLEMLIRKAHRPEPVRAEDMRRYRDQQRARMRAAADAAASSESARERVLVVLEEVLDKVESPGAFPAIRDILVDTEGCVWVREYVRAPVATDWTVFGPDGVIVGRARLPEELMVYEPIYEIGSDYVLGHVIGEDFVEFIYLYTLKREA